VKGLFVLRYNGFYIFHDGMRSHCVRLYPDGWVSAASAAIIPTGSGGVFLPAIELMSKVQRHGAGASHGWYQVDGETISFTTKNMKGQETAYHGNLEDDSLVLSFKESKSNKYIEGTFEFQEIDDDSIE
jgi:hypothetical protein